MENDYHVQANNRPKRNLLPKITISGLQSNDYTNNDKLKLGNSICEKNSTIKRLIDNGSIFEILFIKEDRLKPNLCFAVAKVDKSIYNEIRSLKYQLYIDFSRCKVSNRFHLPQCYNCQKFGHTRDRCPTNNTIVCRFCTSNHDSKTCQHKGNVENYKCANCGSNHSSTYVKCPVIQSQLQAMLNRTQGMESLSKNDIRPNAIVT